MIVIFFITDIFHIHRAGHNVVHSRPHHRLHEHLRDLQDLPIEENASEEASDNDVVQKHALKLEQLPRNARYGNGYASIGRITTDRST